MNYTDLDSLPEIAIQQVLTHVERQNDVFREVLTMLSTAIIWAASSASNYDPQVQNQVIEALQLLQKIKQ